MRRSIDLTVAVIALAVLSPLFVIVAIAIMLDSPGNPFYLARRAGRYGRPFRMWKFRTMVLNAAAIGPAITGGRDPRITRLGSLLRKTKIDELPQFVNLLTGDMTLVGPRPEAPSMVALYSEEQRRVLDAKPGITGPQQLEGEESESIPAGIDPETYYVTHLLDRKVRADIEYMKTRTARTDAAIALSTVAYVVRAIFPSRGQVTLSPGLNQKQKEKTRN